MSYPALRTCQSCGAVNRIPAAHLAHTGRCGACKAGLPPSSEPIDVDGTAFREIVAATSVPIFVDFWAAWCAPCRAAAPEVHALARETAGRAVVLKVDTEANPELASQFGIQSIPNFVVIRDGRVVLQQSGVASRDQMKRWLEAAVDSRV